MLDDGAAYDLVQAGRAKRLRMMAAALGKRAVWVLPLAVASGLGVVALSVFLGVLADNTVIYLPLGLLLGWVVAVNILSWSARAALYQAVEGQPGAAVAVLQILPGNHWTIIPAVAGNPDLDLVHLAVGKPGAILVGEGLADGLAELLTAARRNVLRMADYARILEFQVGTQPGQIPLRKLRRTIARLPRRLSTGAAMNLGSHLRALALSASRSETGGPYPAEDDRTHLADG